MPQAKIIEWLRWWASSRFVDLDLIRRPADMATARKWVPAMRTRRFDPAFVTTAQLWEALRAMRVIRRGRPPTAMRQRAEVMRLMEEGAEPKDIARQLSMHRASVYRCIAANEE
jgi:hypothetical protein